MMMHLMVDGDVCISGAG